MNKEPFTIFNFEATIDQIDKANAAYTIAAQSFFDGVDLENREAVERHEKWLCDKIGNYFNDDFTASEIAQWALSK
jgi:hypothetical protein